MFPLLRVAMRHVHNQALAEEVVQETSLAAMEGLHRFRARSSLETWLFGILVNQARKNGTRESRTIPYACVEGPDSGDGGDPHRAVPSPGCC